MRCTCFLFAVCLPFFLSAQNSDPTFEDILSLTGPGTPVLSPNGRHVVFTQRTTDWENNKYDTEIWIIKDGAVPFQLTNNPDGSSSSPQWSPDSQWIAFESNRDEKNQVFIIRLAGGEAIPFTNEKRGINNFQWMPDGKGIVFTMSMDNEKARKARENRYGKYEIDDNEFNLTELWSQRFDEAALFKPSVPEYLQDSLLEEKKKPQLLIESPSYSISNFLISPDGLKIAIGHQPDPLINSRFNSDISILDIESLELTPFVDNESTDGIIAWSPNSKKLLYNSAVDNRTSNYYENRRYFIKEISGNKEKEIALKFDENINGMEWTPTGIYGTAYQKTSRHLVRIDDQRGNVTIISSDPDRIYGFTLNESGTKIAFSGQDNNRLTEIYASEIARMNPQQLTRYNSQISNKNVSTSEVISWKSQDGTTIEGILHKPYNFDPSKKYPLFVVIHGGPTGISTPHPAPSYVYPIVQWLNKGALVLQPNYRGSAGYGSDFRKLNVKNLGVGDAWDVLSGVDHLVDQGIVDPSRMGAMGWSQGGYISAFLTTNTDRFNAISVGAGISDWATYYVNTDIHPFTRQYLKATPWEDPEIYAKTSPMTNINNAKTPTLIQHGEFDNRVPIPNAYQLLQGLRDNDVPVELIVYKGFGHGISKPKERLAAMWHNWKWFARYIWDEELELPVK